MTTFGQYSAITQANATFYTSGQVGIDKTSGLASTTFKEQANQALVNLAAVLGSKGLNMQNVVKTTVYLTNMSDFQVMDEVYGIHFPQNRPARTTVAVKELPRVAGDTDIKIEIEAIAAQGNDR